MIKQRVNIVNFNLLYEILDEIKEHFSFSIIKYNNLEEFINEKKDNFKDSLVVTNLSDKNIDKKNLLIFNDLPIPAIKLIELINIKLIKLKFNHQSRIDIKGYELNLNSKFFSMNDIHLKLTEKEIEIILYLHSKKTKHSILDLQKNIWGYASDLETHTVETHIYRLRKKINDKFKDKNFIISHTDGYFIE
jgi:hypothetical protein